MRELVVVLAVVAAASLAVYAVVRGLSVQPERSFEEAYEVKKAMLAGRLSGTTVHVLSKPMTINLTVDGRSLAVPASRVLVFFPARGPVFEESTPEPWRTWANGTHAGTVSYLKVLDDGHTLRVYYYSATPYRGASACVYASGSKLARLYAGSGGRVEWYSFTGPREILIEEVRVEPCRQ